MTEDTSAIAKARRRLRRLRTEREEQDGKIKEARGLARGASASKRKGIALEFAAAQAEREFIDGEIGEIESALPELVEAEGKTRAQALIASIAAKVPGQLKRLLTAQEEELAASVELVAKVEHAGVVRVALLQGQLEIKVLRHRWPDLRQPSIPEVLELLDVAPSILRACRTTPIGPKMPRFAHTASATPEERQRETWKQLEKWLDKHNKSLGEEAQGIFASVGIPEWQTDEEQERAAETEAREKKSQARFGAELEGASATVGGQQATRQAGAVVPLKK